VCWRGAADDKKNLGPGRCSSRISRLIERSQGEARSTSRYSETLARRFGLSCASMSAQQPAASPVQPHAKPVTKEADPYRLDPADVEDPPRTFGATMKRIGPGMILAASIVGSGELIATTTLGAEVGYVALWLVVISCLIKPVIQAELGRYAIATGEPTLEGLGRVPPRFRGGWIPIAWGLMTLMTLLQVGAMFGGVAVVMNSIVPSIPVQAWVPVFLALTLLLLLSGGYERVERLAMVKVGLFTLVTLMAAVLLMRSPDFHWGALAEGFSFQLPDKGLGVAIAVFGITGVGTSELFMYPYWCVEKGYARSAGPRDGSKAWQGRARGWVRVMYYDIAASMIIYTVATIAFFLLGAGILHPRGLVPRKEDMISVLSNIYTETLGPWALPVFYFGAVATLYGTIFAATASNARVFADLTRLFGFFKRDDYAARVRVRKWFIVALSVIPALAYLLMRSPVKMVEAGAKAQTALLPVVALGALYLRHKRLPPELRPSAVTTVALWVATIFILAFIGFWLFK
jgi:manganese transport protein